MLENFARVTAQSRQVVQSVSLHRQHRAQLSEAAVAEAAHHDEMLCASKRPEAFAVFDDARGKRRPDARQSFKLGACRMIERDAGRSIRLNEIRGRRFVARSRDVASRQCDAGDSNECNKEATTDETLKRCLAEHVYHLHESRVNIKTVKSAADVCKMLEV